MKRIERKKYLDSLIASRENNMIKIVTGMRRCGKSFLLDPIYTDYLISSGVKADHIIKVDLEDINNNELLDGLKLENYILEKAIDDDIYYVILDEIQLVDNFIGVLNGLLKTRRFDIYVTGSNSRFLSSDIPTEFRGRGEEIRVWPLSFSEFLEASDFDRDTAWKEYLEFGGLPLVLDENDSERKMKYLSSLFMATYLRDMVERNNVRREDALNVVTSILASSLGSLINIPKIANTFRSRGDGDISENTVRDYIKFLTESFIIERAERFDIKGRAYIGAQQKYYFSDNGIRNIILNYRQDDKGALMENVVYNELLRRGYRVDVGVVENRENGMRKQFEVDFVCNKVDKRYYIQSALNMDNYEKILQEEKSLNNIRDGFKRIILRSDITDEKSWYTEDGILVMSVFDFLLNENSLERD